MRRLSSVPQSLSLTASAVPSREEPSIRQRWTGSGSSPSPLPGFRGTGRFRLRGDDSRLSKWVARSGTSCTHSTLPPQLVVHS